MMLKKRINQLSIPKKLAIFVLSIWITIAVLSAFIANDTPLLVKDKSNWFCPAFFGSPVIASKTATTWRNEGASFILSAPIPYHPTKSDLSNANYVSPFEPQQIPSLHYRHWLGTGKRGEDTLSALIYGARTALLISSGAMFIAAAIGIGLGVVGGWFHSNPLAIYRGTAIVLLIGIVLGWFYGFQLHIYNLIDALKTNFLLFGWVLFKCSFVFLLFAYLMKLIGDKICKQLLVLNKKITLPIDTGIIYLTEAMVAVPKLAIILIVAAIFRPSVGLLTVIIGCISWPTIARLTRAELIKQQQQEYVLALKGMGFSGLRIVFKHLLPNCKTILFTSLLFTGIAAIVAESSLSYLGTGIPATATSWGTLMHSGKENLAAWWLIVFPALCIFIVSFAGYSLISTENRLSSQL